MAKYYMELFSDQFLYKLDDNGDVLVFSQDSLDWIPLSGMKNFDVSWVEIDEDAKNRLLFTNYINGALNNLDDNSEDLGYGKIDFGTDFKFYEYMGRIFCQDDNGNVYFCLARGMIIDPYGVKINKNWQALEEEEIYEKIVASDVYSFEDFSLYLDKDNNVIAFKEDEPIPHFVLFNNSGEVAEMHKKARVLKSWKKIDYSYIENLGDNYEKEINMDVIDKREAIFEGLEIEVPSFRRNTRDDIRNIAFYKNPFGQVFAMARDGTEYVFTTKTLEKVTEGTIDTSWDRISGQHSIVYAACYYASAKFREENDILPPLLSLDVFMNMNGDICGYWEDGKEYRMNKITGAIEKVKKGDESPLPHHHIDKLEAWKRQGEVIYQYEINEYINSSEKKAISEGKGAFGSDITFYGVPEDPDFRVYARDENFNEYFCTINGMTPTAKFSITENFVPIKDNFVLTYLNYQQYITQEKFESKNRY